MATILDEISHALIIDQEMYGPFYQLNKYSNTTINDESSEVEQDKNEPTFVNEHSNTKKSITSRSPTEITKAASIDELYSKAIDYFDLNSDQKLATFYGSKEADIMVLFDNPYTNSDGEPTDIAVHTLLTKMLAAIQLSINNLYITSISKVLEDQRTRDLNVKERNFFIKECSIIKPKMVLCFDQSSIQKLMNKNSQLARGEHKLNDPDLALFYTHSPFLLEKMPALKREAWEDLQSFRKLLDNL